jgi:hypothetical protein
MKASQLQQHYWELLNAALLGSKLKVDPYIDGGQIKYGCEPRVVVNRAQIEHWCREVYRFLQLTSLH